MSEQELLRQDLGDKGEFQRLYMMLLLFNKQSSRPDAAALQKRLQEELGPVDLVADVDGGLTTLALRDYPVTYKDDQKVPAQVMMADFAPFDGEKITPLDRTQQWECPESGTLLEECTHQLMISDFMAAGLPYKERCHILTKWVEIAVELLPDCTAVWFAPSGKLLTREQVLGNPYQDEERFLHGGLNIRFFNIQNSQDMLVDTLGLYAVGLPDIQYHFNSLDPNHVVRHAFNVAAYVFAHEAPVESGETIAGLSGADMDANVKWKCQYENSLIQPAREVMDVCPGEFAAGNRA